MELNLDVSLNGIFSCSSLQDELNSFTWVLTGQCVVAVLSQPAPLENLQEPKALVPSYFGLIPFFPLCCTTVTLPAGTSSGKCPGCYHFLFNIYWFWHNQDGSHCVLSKKFLVVNVVLSQAWKTQGLTSSVGNLRSWLQLLTGFM